MTKSRRIEIPLLLGVFLDLLGFGMIIADIQLRAASLVPKGVQPGPVIGVLLAITFVIQTLVSPHWGHLSDRKGRRAVFILCTAFSALGMLIYGLADSLAWLFVSRLVAGLGGANVAIAQAFVSDTHEGDDRMSALGRVGAAVSLGLIAGPPLGGQIAHYGGHRLLGLGAAGASFVGLILIALMLPKAAPREAASTGRRPIFDFALLREYPQLKRLALVAVVAWFSLATLEGTFARLIKATLGYDERHFGFIFGYESFLTFAIQGVALAWFVKRFRPIRILQGGYVLQGVGLALNPAAATLAAAIPPLGTLVIASTLYAFGSSIAGPTVNGLCSQLVPDERQGELFGLLQGTRSIGFVLGPIIGGALFDLRPEFPYYMAGLVCLGAAALVPRDLKDRTISA